LFGISGSEIGKREIFEINRRNVERIGFRSRLIFIAVGNFSGVRCTNLSLGVDFAAARREERKKNHKK
jgi:hypothetical protein